MKLKYKKIEGLSDIKIYKYQKYLELAQNSQNLEKDSKQYIINVVEIFYDDISKEDISHLPYLSVIDMYENVMNLLKSVDDNVVEIQLVRRFKIGNIEFGLVPDFDDISFAELMDLDTDDFVQQLCILYRPIIKKKRGGLYSIMEYNADIQYKDIFAKHLGLDVLFSFNAFFLQIWKDLQNSTLKSLEEEEDLNPNQKKDLLKSGDGLHGFMNSVRGI